MTWQFRYSLNGNFAVFKTCFMVVVWCFVADLDVQTMLEEARSRWLRPNEIHAVLSNPKYFTINVKPVNLPTSNISYSVSLFNLSWLVSSYNTTPCYVPVGGRIILFDRKMLRNFRKDGHNWKKKKDGRTVKEAHEHLKVSVLLFLSLNLKSSYQWSSLSFIKN